MIRPGRTLPRTLHPAAWWLWALGLVTAASRTTNPLLLGLIVAVAGYVVTSRRGDAPWALAFRSYLAFGLLVVGIRVGFRVLAGGPQGDHVLLGLPGVTLPGWAAGIELLGPFTLEELLGGFGDGLRLATMLICVGAANALANPKRLLKVVPGALAGVSSAVVVALTVAPQLIESVQRVRRARRLRGGAERGPRVLAAILLPVLADALDRSLALAAALDSRGYGRATGPAAVRRGSGALVVAGLAGVCAGLYGLLDPGEPPRLGYPVLLGGLLVAALGALAAGRRVRRTRYRPDRWRPPELTVAACGVTAATLVVLTTRTDAAVLLPPVSPPAWPRLSPLPLLAVVAGLLPAWLAPPPATGAEAGMADAGRAR
jgi:energy-coupling factor transport system permease protein